MEKQKTLREHYLEVIKDSYITAISFTGFQVKGFLKDGDLHNIILAKNKQYGGCKDVLLENFLAIIPEDPINVYPYPCSDNEKAIRTEYLFDLLEQQIIAFSANGFQLSGKLVCFDDKDIVIETRHYGRSLQVLMCNIVTVAPN